MEIKDHIYNFENFSERDKTLITRAIKTLYGNIIKKPENDDKFTFSDYQCIVPSPRTYQGVWNWDSAFHLLAISRFDKKISQDQSRVFFDNMLPNGQLPDVIYTTGKKVVRFTKPPVFAWAIMCADQISPDTDFLKYAYPYLKKNLAWWEKYRFGGTLFFYKKSKMESGWDNTVRFDFPHLISGCYAIDCNCFMFDFYRSMEYIAKRIGKYNEINIFKSKKDKLSANINKILYSEKNGWYCDYNFKLKKFTENLSPASFMPLFCNIADKKQAENAHKLIKKSFYPGMPTISYDNKKYASSNYWRGPCWLNTAYFAVKGLKNYGYNDTAKDITETILQWCYDNTDSIYEYYDSRNGKGLGAQDFGWSCVFIIELILMNNI